MFLIIFVFSGSYAQESNNIEELASETWAIILKKLDREDVSFEKKIALINEFIAKSPEKSSVNSEAKVMLEKVESSASRLKHYLNRNLYVNKTEWFATGFVSGNYGLGFTTSFATFRWKNVFWESMRFQFTILNIIGSWTMNGKTMVGMPFFYGFANQHELRLSTGLSGGYSRKVFIFFDQSNDHSIDFDLSIPIEISYVFHADKNFAFQTGLMLDMPVLFHIRHDGYYLPIISTFIGFRI